MEPDNVTFKKYFPGWDPLEPKTDSLWAGTPNYKARPRTSKQKRARLICVRAGLFLCLHHPPARVLGCLCAVSLCVCICARVRIRVSVCLFLIWPDPLLWPPLPKHTGAAPNRSIPPSTLPPRCPSTSTATARSARPSACATPWPWTAPRWAALSGPSCGAASRPGPLGAPPLPRASTPWPNPPLPNAM